MTEEEKKIFWKLDDKLYLVDKNKTYKKLFKSFIKYNKNEITQEFINKLIAWYSVKYGDKYIEAVFCKDSKLIDYSLIRVMNFEKLKYRIDGMIKKLNNTDILGYQYLVVMAGWGLIYDKNSKPENGLFRATKMIEEFNSYYDWNLNANIYESIINMDYSQDNPVVVKLLEKRKKEIENKERKKTNKLPKIKKLFRR